MKLGMVSSQVLFRKSLTAFIKEAGIFDGVVEFDSALDLLEGVDKSQPFILIIHFTEPSIQMESMAQLRDLLPEARLLFLADNPDEEFGVRALEAGASGCLSTMDSPQVVMKAVEKVAKGERWFAHRVTDAVIDKLIAGRRTDTMFADNLTPREWEVLALIAQGHSDKEVANHLFISTETARSHVKSIYKKLQVSTRRAAAVCYFKHVRGTRELLSGPPAAIGVAEMA